MDWLPEKQKDQSQQEFAQERYAWLKAHDELIIYEAIAGSHAYGTAVPESDKDVRGIFVLPQNMIKKYEREKVFGKLTFPDQINDEQKDVLYYEVGRFFELLAKSNPNVIEFLAMPSDCINIKHPLFDLIDPQWLLTRKAIEHIRGYAKTQITKAKGLNKKINWDKNKMVRKTPLDFCWVLDEHTLGAIPLMEFGRRVITETPTSKIYKTQDVPDELVLKEFEYFGLSKIPHMHNMYYVFRDRFMVKNLAYNGVIRDINKSNELALSSIPKGEKPIGVLYYNKDAYSIHCKEYKEYKQWERKRNPARYQTTINHGQGYDSKNMSHCIRLLNMAIEMVRDREINVRRPEKDLLLKIRKGELKYDELLEMAQDKNKEIETLLEVNVLPKTPNTDKLANALHSIRTNFRTT